jgi:hypothetical protein
MARSAGRTPTSIRPRNVLTIDLPVDVLELADPTNN